MRDNRHVDARCRVGDWRFDRASFELEHLTDGRRTRLPHRLGRMLARLVETPGEVVARETLIAAAWDRRGVADEVLSRAVNALRAALGDDSRAPRYVETIPKAGYRLVAPVAPAAGRAPAGAQDGPAAAGPVRERPARAIEISLASIAVLAVVAAIAWRANPSRDPGSADAREGLALDLARERPLTSREGLELGPALSRDGRLLAYTEVDVPDGPTRLVVVERDGAGRHILHEASHAFDARPAFSPDAASIAYRRMEPDGICTLVVVPVLAGDARRLADCANVASGLAWSPGGDAIFYTAPPSGETFAPGLARVALGDGTIVALTTPSLADGPDVDPQFVPGTAEVSFARGRASDRGLYRAALAAPHPVEPLFPGANLIHGHAWLDDRTLVLATDAPGYRALVAWDPERRVQRLLGARGARFPALDQRGSLVYELASYDANVWRASPEGGAPLRLTTSSRYDASPALAPQGSVFAFASIRDGLESVWIGATDRASEQRLPLPRGLRWVRPHWHPDGGSVLVTAYADAGTRAYRHEIASGRTLALDALGEAFGATDLPDGRGIVVARRDSRGYSLHLARGDAPVEPLAGAVGVDEFHAGDGYVAYTRLGEPGVVVAPLDDGAPRVVLAGHIDASNRYDWTAAGRAIWFAARDAGGIARLHRHDLDTGSTDVLAPIAPDAVGATLSVAADGGIVLYARVDALTVDLVEVGLH